MELQRVNTDIPWKTPQLSWLLLLYPPDPVVVLKAAMSEMPWETPSLPITVMGIGPAAVAEGIEVFRNTAINRNAPNSMVRKLFRNYFSSFDSNPYRCANKNITLTQIHPNQPTLFLSTSQPSVIIEQA